MTANISKAAAAMGRRGGQSTSLAKTSAARANGQAGGRPSLRDQAAARVENSPTLRQYTAYIMADWPEGREHWRWVLTAPVREIVDWCEAGK